MNIESYLQKPVWTRRLPGPYINQTIRSSGSRMRQMQIDNYACEELTQANFLDELYPSSHKINCVEYRSLRQKFKTDSKTGAVAFDGFEDVCRSSFGIQQGIRRHKVAHTFGNEMWFGSEGDKKADEMVSNFRSHWSMAGMTDALSLWGSSLFGTGDAAIYLYIKDEKIEYKVFSYEDGDVFNMTKDENGDDLFVRLFLLDGFHAVEMYGVQSVDLWIKESAVPESRFTSAVRSVDGNLNGEKSDDGYILIKSEPHGRKRCPVDYYRAKDVCWGLGQPTIDNIEKILSDLGENNKYYAYQILFLSGGVISLPGAKGMGKVIASKTTDGKAEILKPADASNTFTIELEKNLDLLWETTGTVVLEPKELKGGDYSGAFIRNLYWREVQWAANEIAKLRPAFRSIISQFSDLVGILESDINGYRNLRMSFLLEPCIPKNVAEEITNVTLAKAAGITSVKTASGEIPFNNAREYERIKEEEAEKAKIESEKIKQELEVSQQPDIPFNKIDNRLKTK